MLVCPHHLVFFDCSRAGGLRLNSKCLRRVRTAVAEWLRCCTTNRKVAGSIPDGDIKSFRSHCGPGVDSASNRNEYQEHFLGVKAAGA